MKSSFDRVAYELQEYRQREKRMEKLFSSNIVGSKEAQMERLLALDLIHRRYQKSASPEERLTLQLLNIERSRLTKQLYPGIASRIWRSIKGLFQNISVTAAIQQNDQQNVTNLQAAITKAGFNSNPMELRQHIQSGKPEFTLQFAYFMPGHQSVNYSLNIKKDIQGNYQLDQYRALLVDAMQPSVRKLQIFRLEEYPQLTKDHAYNLLAGRSVYLQPDQMYPSTGAWVKMDFNDKDPDGNFKIKQYQMREGLEIEKWLTALKCKEMQQPEKKAALLTALHNGHKEVVTIERAGTKSAVWLEVNPQTRGFNFYDKDGTPLTRSSVEPTKKTSESQALKEKEKEPIKIAPRKSKGISR